MIEVEIKALLKIVGGRLRTTRKKSINDAVTMSLKSYNDASLKRHGVDCHYICLDYNDAHLKRHS